MTFLDSQVPDFLDFCPRRATKLRSLQSNPKNKTKILMVNAKAFRIQSHFCVSPRSPKCNFREPLQAKMDWKEKIRDLKQQFEEFWERHLQRGAGRFSAPPPFVGLLSHKLFRLVLKVSYLFFQSLLACRGSQKLHFVVLGLKHSFIFFSLPFRYAKNVWL